GAAAAGPSGTRVSRPSAPQPPPVIPAGLDQTQVLAAQSAAPAAPGAPAPVRTGPDLLLVAEGKEHRFRHPAQITIGRLPDCTVVLKDPASSRMHGTVTSVPRGWTYTNQSNEGTFLNGRRITTKQFDERTVLRLGHPVAGPELTLVPILSAVEEEKRIARRRLARTLLIAGVVAGVLVLILGIATATVLLSRDDDEPLADSTPSDSAPGTTPTDGSSGPDSPDELTDAELDSAKAAAVKIIAESHALEDPSQEFAYAGSGSIIRSDGLILTNAHVAAPESPGIVEQYGPEAAIANPEYLLISITDGATDTTAPPEYRACVIEADGYLDVAVIQICAKADGSPLDGDVSLPTVPIGSSAEVRAGDDVTVLGFPAVAGSGDSITVTTGVISTVLNDPDLGPRSEFDTEARIAPGNSGGMAVDNDGNLIGLPTALQFDPSGSPVTSGRIRAIDIVKALIERAELAVG
ncbi:trypsin-like peptidase domain-containing protein, partial [Nocardioides pelophilus]|uniref:trypsin-like peptidase domain-containing protein n=1 Tax=Nocardioides pelophilus TaxID=2172019 RepID=UPI0015FEC099